MGVIELGASIGEARRRGELSFRDVRDATGLALSHLQRLERGQVAEPSPHVLRKLAAALPGLSYEGLMREVGYL